MIMGAWGLGRKRLPYDAEVEYLESTGMQWIDTGIHATQNTTAKIKCAWMTVANDNPVFGADNGGTWNGSYILMQNTGIRFIRGGPVNVFAQQSWIKVVAERMYEIECLEDGIKLDGNFAAFSSTPTTTVYTNKTIPLYAWWRQAQPWTTKCRIAYVSFAESGSQIRDFIPVRFTNELGQSEGAMYDRANPTMGMNPDGSPRTDGLYRNRGTGAFLWAEKQ